MQFIGSSAAVLHHASMEIEISGIIANLSTTHTYNIGIGMANTWTYPESASEFIPMPLTRFTTFRVATGDSVDINCKKAIVTAKVSRGQYGVMKAVVTDIIEVIDE